MMPGLDGFALLRELRRDERTRTVPVILLSARAGEESKVEGLGGGADDYIVKPFSAVELVARVESAVRMSRLGASTSAPSGRARGGLARDLAAPTLQARAANDRENTPSAVT
jgi:DNA-binding response OmpR family regulator